MDEGIRRVCPLLERESATAVLPYAPSPWVLRQCLETGFVFLENPPRYESFRHDYAWEVTSRQQAESRREREPLLQALSAGFKALRRKLLHRHRIHDLARACLRDAPPGTVHLLDVGCGWGGLLKDLIGQLPAPLARRCAPHGIEISAELSRVSAAALEPLGGSCVNDNALEGLARFPAGHFSLVVMSSFLEHEMNPLPLLRRCRERLRPGGRIIVKVPNYASLNRRLRGARWCGFRWPDHVNHFTPRTLRAMVRQAGLEVERMGFLDRHPFSDNMYAVVKRPA
jgi:SAM-dependent methyltransferase